MNLLQTAVALVAAELGIALVPESFRYNLPVRGVVYKPLAEPAPAAEMVAVWREDNESPLLATFLSGLTALVREGSLAHKRAPDYLVLTYGLYGFFLKSPRGD